MYVFCSIYCTVTDNSTNEFVYAQKHIYMSILLTDKSNDNVPSQNKPFND